MMQREFVFPPRTHRDDPLSSFDAEQRSQRTWGEKHREILATLRDAPGPTASELAVQLHSGIWPNDAHARLCEVRKRLSDLRTCEIPLVRRAHDKGARESRWWLEGS